MRDAAVVLRKELSANDVGATGSHQVGILVPKPIANHVLPTLVHPQLNPDMWLEVRDERGNSYRWRYIHYNNKTLGRGTRDEFRLTHVTEFLNRAGATSGDVLELRRDATRDEYRARIVTERSDGESALVLMTSGHWSVVRLPS